MIRDGLPKLRALSGDTRGAMMVIGLVMAIFLVAALYYVVGIAEAITQRETMQDAADAGAFSAAVLHARGMNVIVLINVVMAALLAILVALKLLEAVLGIALVLLAVAAFFSGGATATAIPEVEALRRDVRLLHDELRPGIFTTLQALHTTARGVRAIVPWTAQLRVLQVVREHGPHASAGFALPARTALPTQDGKFSKLCEKAGDFVGDTAALAIPDLPGGVDEEVGDVIGDLAKARADWFCGAKGADAPKKTIKETHVLPMLAARTACEAYSPGGNDYDADEHKALCDAAAKAEKRWEPNRKGDCKTKECTERAERARVECKPDADRDLRNWMYQHRTVLQKWGYKRGRVPAWKPITEEPVEGPLLERPGAKEKQTRPPCGRVDAMVAPGWNQDMHPDGEPDVPLPVCVEEPTFPGVPSGKETAYHEQEITEVTQVYGCVEVRKREIDVGKVTKGDRLDPADAGDTKSPQVASDPDLGGDGYQLRAVALGSLPRAAPEQVVRVASWGRKTGSVLHDVATRFGRISFAQAEYYYAVEDPKQPDPGRWLWNMNWTARLRRFRMPTADVNAAGDDSTRAEDGDAARWGVDTVARDLTEACQQTPAGNDEDALPGCASTETRLREIEHVIAH